MHILPILLIDLKEAFSESVSSNSITCSIPAAPNTVGTPK